MTQARDADLTSLLDLVRSSLGVSAALLLLTDGTSFASSRSAADEAGLRAHAADHASALVLGGLRTAMAPLESGNGTVWIGRRGPQSFAAAALEALRSFAGLMDSALLRREEAARLAANLLRTKDELARKQAEIEQNRRIFERASTAARIGVWECDLTRGNRLRWTDAVYDLFDLPRQSPVERDDILKLYDPASRLAIATHRERAIRDGTGFSIDVHFVTALGNDRWIRLTGEVETENGVPVRFFGMKQDITEEKALWDQTRYLAESDVMTGLANRSLFQATLSVIGAKNGGRGAVGALLLVDLDGFKQVNDTFGHALGDECLRQIALRLRDVCRTAILVARVGGDEFAVLMDDATGPDQARLLALAILQALSPPVLWGEYSFRIGASIGIAIPDASRQDNPSELFTQADIALYAAKAGGKNTFRIFDPQMKRDCDLRFETVRNIARALSADELALFYQPKLRLDDGSHAGFEALLRWCKPCGEVVTAGAFQSAFDDPELSARIGRFVVEQAVQRAAHWHRQGLDFGHIAINLSTAQLLDPSFGDVLIARMAELGLAPHMIEVEVTENVFLDKEQGPVQRILERLKDSGVRVALDDFGTGHASLVHLRSYPIDIIKIDRSFVRHFLHSVQDRAILETILRLGASLGMDIVAEGIETVPQFETLRALGCKLGQGFLFSQAVPPDAAAALLRPIGFAPLRQAV